MQRICLCACRSKTTMGEGRSDDIMTTSEITPYDDSSINDNCPLAVRVGAIEIGNTPSHRNSYRLEPNVQDAGIARNFALGLRCRCLMSATSLGIAHVSSSVRMICLHVGACVHMSCMYVCMYACMHACMYVHSIAAEQIPFVPIREPELLGQ